MTFKLTFIFNCGAQGWSEIWYCTANDYATATARAKTVAAARSKLLGQGAWIEAVRVSDVAIYGDAEITEFTYDGLAKVSSVADYPANAILARAEAGPLYRRAVWLRGTPDVWVTRRDANCEIVLPPILLDNLGNLLTAMKLEPPMQLAVHSKELTGAVGVKITGLSAGVLADTMTITAPGFEGKEGENVLMRQWTGPDKSLLNRSRRIIVADDPDFVIDFDFARLSKPGKNSGGIALTRHLTYRNITAMKPERTALRNTGKAFFVAPGRHKAPRP